MSGIKFFEALVDGQLLFVDYYLDLYKRQGFSDSGCVEINPAHATIWAESSQRNL